MTSTCHKSTLFLERRSREGEIERRGELLERTSRKSSMTSRVNSRAQLRCAERTSANVLKEFYS